MSRRARFCVTMAVVAAAAVIALNAAVDSAPSPTTLVTVSAGDTLWSVARRVAPDQNVWWVIDKITALSSLTSEELRPGQVLTVPAG